MKNHQVFFLFMCLLPAENIFAQNLLDAPSNSSKFIPTPQTVMTFDNRYEGVKGFHTFFEEFNAGTIVMTKSTFDNALLNFDAYTGNLLAKIDRINEVVQLKKEMVKNFTMRNTAGEVFFFDKKNLVGTPAFLLELVQDSVALYCKIKKVIKKADFGGAYKAAGTRYDEFMEANIYYTIKDDGELIEIKNTKKGLLKMFPQFANQLESYLKKGKINFNDYRQMKLIFLYINSLDD